MREAATEMDVKTTRLRVDSLPLVFFASVQVTFKVSFAEVVAEVVEDFVMGFVEIVNVPILPSGLFFENRCTLFGHVCSFEIRIGFEGEPEVSLRHSIGYQILEIVETGDFDEFLGILVIVVAILKQSQQFSATWHRVDAYKSGAVGHHPGNKVFKPVSVQGFGNLAITVPVVTSQVHVRRVMLDLLEIP